MEEGGTVRSGDHAGVVVKDRNPSGCLIVRKNVDEGGGVGSSRPVHVYQSKKKRQRLAFSILESSEDELVVTPPRRSIAQDTIRVCNGLNLFDKGISQDREIVRKRSRLDLVRRTEDNVTDGSDEEGVEMRSRLDVFEFDEYDWLDEEKTRRKRYDVSGAQVGGRGFMGSMSVSQSGSDREFGTGSSRDAPVGKRKNLYFDRNRGKYANNNRIEGRRDDDKHPISSLREKYMGNSDEPIRLQGKNGVLKVMVNKKKNAGPVKNYDPQEAEESKKNISKRKKKPDGFQKNRWDFEGHKKSSVPDNIVQRKDKVHPSFHSETRPSTKLGSFGSTVKSHTVPKKPLAAKGTRACDSDSEGGDIHMKLGSKNVETQLSMETVRCDVGKTVSSEKLLPPQTKEGKVRRGSGTEKQKLREKIRDMLINAGWKIDYRPRRNRDYLDAVYINPSGTAYWSIIKAYDAFQRQQNEDKEAKSNEAGPSFTLISDDVLSQLTRNTRKKILREEKKKRDGSGIKRSVKAKYDLQSTDSDSNEEKLSSFIKQGNKLGKTKRNDNGFANVNTKSLDSAQHAYDTVERSSLDIGHSVQGRKSRKLGRCTLLARSSSKALNSDIDDFVPYNGKRTLLSWLIGSGVVQLSQKVQYMNRRQTRVMLEGWITRDGIHCGCCSKILMVSKFEIHAGSKLHQPFQNIYLDSGVSLLQCQIDAWNRQEESERIGFHSVKTDGDDPNDDTCGICADGGDLICCDGCPSTFHQNCLDIKMLPPGDWHCPNCTCKFCGVAHRIFGDNTPGCALLSCSLCEKKFHETCTNEMETLPFEANCSFTFCGKTCRELFEHLQKTLGVKHELEGGFSWSLVRRMDAESDTVFCGLPQRVECNSKLAVALNVVNECFLPIIDRRSGINLIHNVIYNCGSNFNRLNYNSFYTAILERGDEIISVASIRFHGTQLAEMPFIGTRPIYRRQGMCRRLFCAIESALFSFKVEKLIIPAIADLMHTWRVIFGFTRLEETLKKEMRSMNMLVFPGVDMLQKLLLEPDKNEGKNGITADATILELENKQPVLPEVEIKPEMDSSIEHGSTSTEHDDTGFHHADEMTDNIVPSVLPEAIKPEMDSPEHGSSESDDVGFHRSDEVTDNNFPPDSRSQCPVVSLNKAPLMSNSLDASCGPKSSVLNGRTGCHDSVLGDKLAESTSVGHDPIDGDAASLHCVNESKDKLPEFSSAEHDPINSDGASVRSVSERKEDKLVESASAGQDPMDSDGASFRSVSETKEEKLAKSTSLGHDQMERGGASLCSVNEREEDKLGKSTLFGHDQMDRGGASLCSVNEREEDKLAESTLAEHDPMESKDASFCSVRETKEDRLAESALGGHDPMESDGASLHIVSGTKEDKLVKSASGNHDPMESAGAILHCISETKEDKLVKSASGDHDRMESADASLHCISETKEDILSESATSGQDSVECDGASLLTVGETKDEVSAADCDFRYPDVPSKCTSTLGVHDEFKVPVLVEATACSDSPLIDKKIESAIGRRCPLSTGASHTALEVESVLDSSVVHNAQNFEEGDMDNTHKKDGNVFMC